MRRLNQDVQFRSKAASPLAYTVAIPLAEMALASLGVAVIIGLLSTLGGADVVGAAETGAVAFVVLAAILLALRFGKAVLWGLERATGADLDGDSVVGKPESHFVYVRQGQNVRRNSELDDLADFVRGCYTRGTGRRAWAGARLATTNHKVTRGMYDRFCRVLLRAGILEDLGDGRGSGLTCELDEALDALGLE